MSLNVYPTPIPVSASGSPFGDGSDGDVTISAPTTLTRDMNYGNLDLTAAETLQLTVAFSTQPGGAPFNAASERQLIAEIIG